MNRLLFYFAYGSNLHPLRLRERIPSCRPCGVAALPGFLLRFHKQGQDGSGKADIVHGRKNDLVLGVVYQLRALDKPGLDAAEPGYHTRWLTVRQGRLHREVFAYQAHPEWIDERVRPFFWYKSLLLLGARYHHLSEDYLHRIEAAPAVEDPDPERRARHTRLLVRLRATL